MKMQRFIIPFLLLALVAMAKPVCAQTRDNGPQWVYKLEALNYFDNREYKADIQHSQTIFATRLSPEVGLAVNDELRGLQHRLMLGLHLTKEMGKTIDEKSFIPTVYYHLHHQPSGFSMSLGSLPYTLLSEDLPAYILYDSIAYARPNIQGALLQYRSDRAFADFICDWRSMQTLEQREAFRLILNGQYRWNILAAGALMQMNHLASYKFQKNGVCDDMLLQPYLSLNLPLLDSLQLKAGYLLSYQCDRTSPMTPSWTQALVLDVCARWKHLGIKNSLYVGSNLQSLYDAYGSLLYQGDSFYRSSLYNRCDLYVYLFRNNFVNCLFSWNLHYTKEYGLDYQQQLICRFSTDGLRQNRAIRNLFGK